MKAEFVNPFLNPAIEIWRKELGNELTFANAEMVSGNFTTEDLTAIIGVTGALKGNVFYEFSQSTALLVAGTMCGEPIQELDDMSMSALGEMANIITGNATTLLAGAGYNCDITTPVLLPKGAAFQTPNPQIRAFFTSSMGPLSIRVSLVEARPNVDAIAS